METNRSFWSNQMQQCHYSSLLEIEVIRKWQFSSQITLTVSTQIKILSTSLIQGKESIQFKSNLWFFIDSGCFRRLVFGILLSLVVLLGVALLILCLENLKSTFIHLPLNSMGFYKWTMRIYLALNLLILEHAIVNFISKRDCIPLHSIVDLGINLQSQMIICKISAFAMHKWYRNLK